MGRAGGQFCVSSAGPADWWEGSSWRCLRLSQQEIGSVLDGGSKRRNKTAQAAGIL